MTEYIIKSTISITVLYILYYFFLRNIKSFEFNRFYLLFVVVFSLIIPFIQFSMGIDLIINQNTQDFSSSINSISIQGSIVKGQKDNVFDLIGLLTIIYILISAILLMRFVFNLWKIIKLINNSSKDLNSYPRIILSQKETLPYSFFKFIIVNKTEYEKGQINYDLILHEQAHCNQNHSLDIVFIELIKIIFWFNPIIWILKKEMQLNHEYLADNKVLQTQNLKTYQDILLNLVFRNNSTYLASNFNYSLTKKRLIMINRNDNKKKRIISLLSIGILSFILFMAISCNKENKLILDNYLELKLPNEMKYNSENETYSYKDLIINISFDSIRQAGPLLPINNFTNIMNVTIPGTQLVTKYTIDQNDLTIGVKEILDTNHKTNYFVFSEADNKLLMIECSFNNTNKQNYQKDINEMISSIKRI